MHIVQLFTTTMQILNRSSTDTIVRQMKQFDQIAIKIGSRVFRDERNASVYYQRETRECTLQ